MHMICSISDVQTRSQERGWSLQIEHMKEMVTSDHQPHLLQQITSWEVNVPSRKRIILSQRLRLLGSDRSKASGILYKGQGLFTMTTSINSPLHTHDKPSDGWISDMYTTGVFGSSFTNVALYSNKYSWRFKPHTEFCESDMYTPSMNGPNPSLGRP
jgi:hypothetical protein